MATSWFIYNFPGNPVNPKSYSIATQKPLLSGFNVIEGIYASVQMIDGIPRPVIDGTLKDEIIRIMTLNDLIDYRKFFFHWSEETFIPILISLN